MVVDTYRRGSEEELERIERREFVIRMYYVRKKNLCPIKGKKKNTGRLTNPKINKITNISTK